MASKNAVAQCYNLLSANVPIIKAQTNKDLMLLLTSWQMALEDLSDTELFAATKRFLKEVTDVNRGVVITKLLIDLAKPKELPFDSGEVINIFTRLLEAPNEQKLPLYKQLKQENPEAIEIIDRYGYTNIAQGNVSVMYSQLKKDYEALVNQRKTVKQNELLESYKLEFKDGMKLLEAA